MTEYHDMDGKPTTLHRLCCSDPTWAASRIETLERQLSADQTRQHMWESDQDCAPYECSICGEKPSHYNHAFGAADSRRTTGHCKTSVPEYEPGEKLLNTDSRQVVNEDKQ